MPCQTADLELRLAVRHRPSGRPRREGRSHRLYESRQQNAVSLQDFVPEYENQAIIFTGDDLGSDRAMIAVLLLHRHCHYGLCVCRYYVQYHRQRGGRHRHRCGPPATAGARLVRH